MFVSGYTGRSVCVYVCSYVCGGGVSVLVHTEQRTEGRASRLRAFTLESRQGLKEQKISP